MGTDLPIGLPEIVKVRILLSPRTVSNLRKVLAMGRKRTGLRNRRRSGGRSVYSVERKARTADRYGEYQNGRQVKQDVIAGHALKWHETGEKYSTI